MLLTLSNIRELLKPHFDAIELIESEKASEARYNEKGIVLFKGEEKSRKVVLKCFIDIVNENNLVKAKKEFEYLNIYRKENGIINIYNFITLTDQDGIIIGIVLVEEFFSETLASFLKKGKKLNQKQIIEFLIQMNRILYAIHYNPIKPIIHCDIKPSNIGIRITKKKYEYVLFDFDIAIENNGNNSISIFKLMGLTPEYTAPEILNNINSIINNEDIISNKVDIYSVGVIALQLALNKSCVKNDDLKYCDRVLNKKLSSFICPLIKSDPAKRSPVVIKKNKNNSSKLLINSNLYYLLIIILLAFLLSIVLFIKLTL